MSTTPTRRLTSLALTAVVALIAALLVAAAPPASAQGGDQALALDAEDNVAIAIDWSELAFPDGADEVLLGREDLFADTRATGGLQAGDGTDGTTGRPLLLTPGDALDERVAAELSRLAPTTVHVLGGENAIEQSVVDELEAAGYTVNRFEGETRTETAVAVAETVDADTALLVRGFGTEGGDATQAFADTIAAAAWAAENGWAVLFTQTDVLTASTAAHMEAASYAQVYVVGGTDAVSAEVEAEADDLAGEVTRVEGDTRFDTAVAIAAERGYATHDDAGLSILVDGQSADAWADGFSAAALAGANGAPVVLANSATDALPAPTAEFLAGDESPLPDVDAPGFAQADTTAYSLICGPTAPDGQCEEAAEILELTVVTETDGPATDGQDLTVTPAEPGEAQGEETREFTATELEAGTTYTIALVPAENVQVSEAGADATFTASEDGTAAGLGDTDATIPQVNGEDVATADDVQTAEPAEDGTLTFTVGGDTFDEVVEVVFVDADEDGALDLDEDGTPIEEELYGVGGPTRVLPPAADGTVGLQDADILYVDYETGVFATADATYTPDDDDAIQVVDEADAPLNTPSPGPLGACDGSEDITVEELLAVLTVGDQIDGSSAADPEGTDTLCIEDATPTAPTAAEESVTDTSITLTLTDLDPEAVVTIYQAAEPAEGEDPAADPESDEVLLGDAADTDPETEGMQVVLDGLTPETEYHLYATQTLGPQESDPSNIVTSTTTASS